MVGHDRFSAKLDAIDERLGFRAGMRTLLLLQLTFSFIPTLALGLLVILSLSGAIRHIRSVSEER